MKKVLAFFICVVMFVSIMPAAALADETEPTPDVSPTATPADEPTPDVSPTPAPTVVSRYALLSGIEATTGTWNKEFSSNTRSYILTLDENVKTVTLTPQKGGDTQTFTINRKKVESVTVSVDNGKHKHVTIKVKQAGKRTRVYYVKVVRRKSSNNDLKSLSVSAGTMGSEFDPAQLEYNVALDRYTPFITVKAAKANSHATMRIDGYRKTYRKYNLAPGEERTVKITVRSQTGVTKTYLVHIQREANPITDKAEALIDFAKHYIGTTPYVHGGKGPAGFDCSGFVYYCLNGIGYKTGYRTSAAWAKSKFETIPTLDQMLPGDIICFKGHVGIYMGDNMMIDCASSVNGVSIKSCVSPYWIENFRCGKRVFKQAIQTS